MSDDVHCEIDGLDGLEELLQVVLPKQAKTALRRAGRKAGQIWQDAIEEKAPKGPSGFLETHIAVRSQAMEGDDNSTGSIAVSVGPTKDVYPLEGGRTKNRDAAQVARYAEFGTSKQAATPFVQPAFEENKDNVIETFANELLDELAKLAQQSE